MNPGQFPKLLEGETPLPWIRFPTIPVDVELTVLEPLANEGLPSQMLAPLGLVFEHVGPGRIRLDGEGVTLLWEGVGTYLQLPQPLGALAFKARHFRSGGLNLSAELLEAESLKRQVQELNLKRFGLWHRHATEVLAQLRQLYPNLPFSDRIWVQEP